ncbi:MAG: thiamine-phosphate kinase [Bacteroidales bacterium]|nr:thiamine-phosphate kinase [Bacteroidales bacterium]
MLLNELGEFGFIERFSEKYFHKPLKDGFLGIGDDCAVLPEDAKRETLVSTDLLIENVHFIKDEIGGFQLGKKSLAVNLSDLAASGAEPCASFLSLGLPKNTSVEFMDEFFKGYAFLSEKYNCPLLGGDTTKSPENLVINVTVLGKAKKNAKKLRSMAKPGDVICVTGYLGNSAAGLEFLLNKNLKRDENARYLIDYHHNPQPRVFEGMFLASLEGVNAMTDISDGISSDLKHIMKLSQVSAVIETDKLPISKELEENSNFGFTQKRQFALSGGEDYELLLTVDSKKFAAVNEAYFKKFGKKLYQIGTIKNGFSDEIFFTENMFLTNGFDHFSA